MRNRAILFFTLAPLLLGMTVSTARAQNTVQTIAGGGPNNLPVLSSSLGNPATVVLDSTGNSYVVDSYSNRVFKIDASGNVTVFAGNGVPGYSGDGGAATSAQLNYPNGVALDNSGNVFIAEYWNCTVRKVNVSTGNISTVAGTAGACKYGGDGGPATNAELYWPVGITLDPSGNLFIADSGNNAIREVSASTGIISTVAGTPGVPGYAGDGGPATGAKLDGPYGVAVDSSRNLFIADTFNCLVRKVSASNQIISTVAGSYGSGPDFPCGGYLGDGGPATSASLQDPFSVAVDSSGNLFIADTTNCVVREVNASSGVISTVAGGALDGSGNHVCGYSGDSGPATNGWLSGASGVTIDGSGNLLIADAGNNVIREVSASTGYISTIAGLSVLDPYDIPNNNNYKFGFVSYSGDGRPGTQAELSYTYATSIAADSAGNVFIADRFNNALRRISATTGLITTVAGNGIPGYSGDGGPATAAMMRTPFGVTLDGSGNLFIAEYDNDIVRKIASSTGNISTVAGSPGNGNYFGDGGPATSAGIFNPYGIAVDKSGNIFIADWYNCTVREVTASTGDINTVVSDPSFGCGYYGDGGAASQALLYSPYGLATDSSGNLFIAESTNCVIREVLASTGNIYTVAGTPPDDVTSGYHCGYSGDGGSATAATLNEPYGVAVDSAGDLFIADTHNCVIREVVPRPGSGPMNGTIYTVAGNRSCAYSGDGGPPLGAAFAYPSALAFDSAGDLFVLDEFRLRRIQGLLRSQAVPSPSPLNFPTKPLGTANMSPVTVTNPGTVPTSVSAAAISGANAADFVKSSDNCAAESIAPNAGSCTIQVTFTPTVAGLESALLAITDSAGTQTVMLSGAGIDFAIAAASGGTTTATVTQGSSATYSLQVTASGGNPGDQINVSIACAGAPSQTICSGPVSPVVATTATPGVLTITVTTTAPSIFPPLIRRPRAPLPPALLFTSIGLLVAFWLMARTRPSRYRRSTWLVLTEIAGMAVLGVVLASCGGGGDGGGGSGGGNSSGTPVGTYTLRLTGTANSDTHTQTLTLIVNSK